MRYSLFLVALNLPFLFCPLSAVCVLAVCPCVLCPTFLAATLAATWKAARRERGGSSASGRKAGSMRCELLASVSAASRARLRRRQIGTGREAERQTEGVVCEREITAMAVRSAVHAPGNRTTAVVPVYDSCFAPMLSVYSEYREYFVSGTSSTMLRVFQH